MFSFVLFNKGKQLVVGSRVFRRFLVLLFICLGSAAAETKLVANHTQGCKGTLEKDTAVPFFAVVLFTVGIHFWGWGCNILQNGKKIPWM